MFLSAFLILILLLLQRQDFACRPGFLNSAAIQETIVPELNQMTPVTGPRIGKSPAIKFLYPFASPLVLNCLSIHSLHSSTPFSSACSFLSNDSPSIL